MSADRCRGCGRLWSWLGLVLLAPAWLLWQLVLAWARLGDMRSRRRGERSRPADARRRDPASWSEKR